MAYTPLRRRRHDPDATRRALEILGDAGVEGCGEPVLLARGFTIDQLVNLVSAGLATATPQPVVVGNSRYEIPTLRITDDGQRALSGRQGTHPSSDHPPLPDPGPYVGPAKRLAVSVSQLPARSVPSVRIERDPIPEMRPQT
jgi:hypothetical protein